MRTFLYYSAGLIAVYLLVSHATDAGRLINSAGSAYGGAVKVLQGR
jgi:hypothetical protein